MKRGPSQKVTVYMNHPNQVQIQRMPEMKGRYRMETLKLGFGWE